MYKYIYTHTHTKIYIYILSNVHIAVNNCCMYILYIERCKGLLTLSV